MALRPHALALGAVALIGCPAGPSRDDSAPRDSDDPDCGTTDVPDLACTQAAFDSDYFWFARESIRAADRRVHVVEYLLYQDGLAGLLLDELVAAAGRGVEVKVLADEAADETADSLAWLRSASGGAIEATLDSPDTTTHDKLIVADDTCLVGSHNVSSSALSDNHEASMYVADTAVCGFYEDFFQALWEDSDRDPTLQKPAGDDLVPIKNREIAGYLMDCLDGATDEVRLVMYAISYRAGESGDVTDLVNHLVAAHDRGLDVAVILDQSEWITDNDINDEVTALLLDRGVPLRLSDPAVTTHAKAMRCDGTVIVGDANWSYSSMELYNGTSIQVTRPEVTAQYQGWFDEIWDEGEAP